MYFLTFISTFCALLAALSPPRMEEAEIIAKPKPILFPSKMLGFFYEQGEAPVKKERIAHRIMTLNTCMLDGMLPKKYGGMSPAEERMKALGNLIRKENPDVFLGQELTLDTGRMLMEEVRATFAHFWIGIGPIPGVKQSGLFVASKYPIAGKVQFVSFFDNMQSPTTEGRILDRGFFILETEKYFIVTTHLEPGNPEVGGAYRKQQLEFITSVMDRIAEKTGKPFLIAGDLNIERVGTLGDEYSLSGIEELYYDYYTLHHPEFCEETFTCTNLFTHHANGKVEPLDDEHRNEIDDYFLIRKPFIDRFENLEVRLVKTYDLEWPEEAISDHRGYVATFSVE